MTMHAINMRRAGIAGAVIEPFTRRSYDDSIETAIGDLICDLGHLCDRERFDFVAIVRTAVAYWKIEQTDAEGIVTPPQVDILIEEMDTS